jgi:hypothetical protein
MGHRIPIVLIVAVLYVAYDRLWKKTPFSARSKKILLLVALASLILIAASWMIAPN